MAMFIIQTLLLVTLAGFYWQPTAAAAVMSVDIGCEWMKIAIVSPGVPMEIVLNKESKRKTPLAISIRDGEREIGENALSLSTRFPEKVYRNLLELIGKQVDNPVVQKFKERFPFYNIVADEKRNTVVFKHDNETTFTPEMLLAMILEKARDYAQASAGQPIHDAVITVPPYFNQAERRALKSAAELAGLKVLQLISSDAAVALNYGVFRRKDFNSTMQNIMFYDVGAGSAVATIVGYQVVKMKEKGFVEENPQLTILGVGYDRYGGGLELTLRLRDHLAKKFNEKKLSSNDIFKNPRAMSKLLKEAERVKMILSVNPEINAQVEQLFEDRDFKLPITRQEFESLCEDLFANVGKPIEAALKSADLTMDSIDHVILVGAGTRVPRIQEEILKVTKKTELGKSLNTDEAAALGAVYQAAHLSKGFKVKRFNVKESVLFPIQVSFDRELDPSEGSGIKHVVRTLFGSMNAYPQKKLMTFNRHVKDFSLLVNYGDRVGMTEIEKRYFGPTNIFKISTSGVADHLNKHLTDESDYKGVKVHFRMDDSGILILDQVECVFEKSVPEVEDKGEESAFSLIGNKISQLFSGISGDEQPEKTESQEEPPVEMPTSDNDTHEEPAPNVNQTTNATANETTTPEESTLPKNETQSVNKSKIISIKEPVSVNTETLDLISLTKDDYQSFRNILKEYNDKEKEKFELEEARNALESFILETMDKLNEDEYMAATTEEERETMRGKLQTISDWLYEDSYGAKLKVFKEKLSSAKSETRLMYERVREHKDRPDAFTALKDMVNASEYFWRQATNISEEDQYFTKVELDTLSKLINETKKWMTDKQAEQNALEKNKTPVVTVSNIVEKLSTLDREVKYLINKARTTKPKPKKVKNDTQETTNTTESKEESKDLPVTEETDETKPPTEEPKSSQESKLDESKESASTADKAETEPTIKPSETEQEEHTEL